MIGVLKRMIGEFLIRLGQDILRSSKQTEYVRVSRSAPRNRYDW